MSGRGRRLSHSTLEEAQIAIRTAQRERLGREHNNASQEAAKCRLREALAIERDRMPAFGAEAPKRDADQPSAANLMDRTRESLGALRVVIQTLQRGGIQAARPLSLLNLIGADMQEALNQYERNTL